MNRSFTIASRELGSYFFSPIAYVAMALFLAVAGVMFWRDFEPGQPVTMRTVFESMVWLLVVIVPLLSMGLLAQEWSTGTIETMLTAPINDVELVLGKFLGSLTFFVFLLIPTALYLVLLELYGDPDYGAILTGYTGMVLVGALFIAVGLFTSSLTRSQVVAAVAAAAILFVITVLPWWIGAQTAIVGLWRTLIEQGVFTRYADFSKGILDTGNIVFFLVLTVIFLFATIKVVESRRWR